MHRGSDSTGLVIPRNRSPIHKLAVQVSHGLAPPPLIEFLEGVFARERGRAVSVCESFPLVFSSDPRNRFILGNDADGRILGAVVLRFLQTGKCPVALFGFVATAVSHRGLGIASRLLMEAEQVARRQPAGLGLLWSSRHALYLRLGWSQRNFFPSQVVPVSEAVSDLRVLEISEGDAFWRGDALWRLAKQAGRFPWRTLADFRRLSGLRQHIHFGATRFFLLRQGEEAVGYAVTGGDQHLLELVTQDPALQRASIDALGQRLHVSQWVCHAVIPGSEPSFVQEDRWTMVKTLDPTVPLSSLQKVSLSPLDKI